MWIEIFKNATLLTECKRNVREKGVSLVHLDKGSLLTLDSPDGTSCEFAISSSFMSLVEQFFFSLSLMPHIS